METRKFSGLTVEDYERMPPSDQPTELIRGHLVRRRFPFPSQGAICSQIIRHVGNHLERHPLGTLACNIGVITERNPDSVRSADVAFYSFEDVPRGRLPMKYLEVPPRLIFEVARDSNWHRYLHKAYRFRKAGVHTVCLVDPGRQELYLYQPGRTETVLALEFEFQLPEVLGDFHVPVRRFFE